MPKRFSERIGIVEPVHTIQTESISDELRNSLWNFMHSQFENSHEDWIPLAKTIAQFFRKVPVDDLPYNDYDCMRWVKAYFYGLEWYEVYDLVEFLVAHIGHVQRYPQYQGERLEKIYNGIFAAELSGYRFVAGVLAPISNPSETDAISSAMDVAAEHGLTGAGSDSAG